jgi:L-lactate utilization protein LutB
VATNGGALKGGVLKELGIADVLRTNGLDYQEINDAHTELGIDERITAHTEEVSRFGGQQSAWMASADLLVANTGTVVLREPNSNFYHTGGPHKVRIFWAGLEQITQSIADLSYWWPAWEGAEGEWTVSDSQSSGSGLSLVQGPLTCADNGQPEHTYVFIIDQGRTVLLEDLRMREMLYCISCGRCNGVCPTRQADFGPREGVRAGIVSDKPKAAIDYSCTRCGACSVVCPVGIPIHRIMAWKQVQSVAGDSQESDWKAWQSWRKAMLGEGWFGMFGFDQKASSMLRVQMPGPAEMWQPAEKSFARRRAMGQKKI